MTGAGLGWAEVGDGKFNLRLPRVWQKTNYSSYQLLPPRVLSSKQLEPGAGDGTQIHVGIVIARPNTHPTALLPRGTSGTLGLKEDNLFPLLFMSYDIITFCSTAFLQHILCLTGSPVNSSSQGQHLDQAV